MKKHSTKAQTLINLRPKLKKSKICKSFVFTVEEWKKSESSILKSIQTKFNNEKVIIRSSALNEDGLLGSMAGAFDSVKNINVKNASKLKLGINKVILSYGKSYNSKDEILVQRMVDEVSMSGVVFTHELNFGSPYYVINYDDVSGLTDTVTSGEGEYSNRTIYIYRNGLDQIRSKRFKYLINSIKEVELLMNNIFLDIEFAISKDLTVYILQVRSITTQPNWNRSIVNNVDSAIKGIHSLIKSKLGPIEGIYGYRTVLGQMPDWNPAEMIGRAPRALAFSLYEKLITNNAWRIAREKMEYKIPYGQPLMISLGGQPFIDTRLSFQSYLPKNLDEKISHKLVNNWLHLLKDHPEYHDKIEFEIGITTYSFDIDDKINNSSFDMLNRSEKKAIKNEYLSQLLALFSESHPGSINRASSKIDLLSKIQSKRINSDNYYNINQLNILIDECINLGTIPFSILARHGFIAKTLLLSLVKRGIINKDEISKIFGSIKTVASDLVSDMKSLQQKKINKSSFMIKYGHLRPGTYDILSPCYSQMEDFYSTDYKTEHQQKTEKYELKDSQKKSINKLLKEEGFGEIDYEFFMQYIEKATAGREYGKFIFTRTISNILEIIAKFGQDHFLTRSELSHIPINDYLFINNNSLDLKIEDYLRSISKKNEIKNLTSSSVRLPQILFDEAGIFVVPFQVSQPNFITSKQITEKCINLSKKENSDLTSKIVLIENADPGYDWIFSQQISGLITKYGGANSHMAIRCAEFGIPAAIGCGEQRFDLLKYANKIMLDCSSSLIKVID